MTKLKMLVLAFLCLCFLLSSCTNKDMESDENVSGGASSAEESSEPKVQPDPSVKAAVDSFYTGRTINRTLTKNSLSQGKAYYSSFEAGQGDSWLDTTGKMLTDGTFGTQDISSGWVGYVVNNSKPELTIDLGESVDGICDIESHHLKITEFAINYTPGGTVHISDDGENYTQIGSLAPDNEPSANGLFVLGLYLSEPVKARYIKYKFDTTTGWAFISELNVSGYEGEITMENLVDLYPDSKLPLEIKKEELWPSGDSDFNDKINLVSGLTAQVFCSNIVEERFSVDSLNTPITSGKLTDGRYAASNNFSDNEYFRMTRGSVRDIYFDLGKTSALSGYKFSFCSSPDAAVNAPNYINIQVSENGVDFYFVQRINNTKNDGSKVTIEGEFDIIYKARYVKINFPVSTHCYCDEIELTGTKNTANASSAESSGAKKASGAYSDKYTSPDVLDGVKDIILMYNARPSDGGYITEDESLTYFAYRDSEGNILDYMADGFMYLPFGAYDWSTGPSWNEYIDNTFAENYNLDALNSAVKKANDALGGNKKATVYLSILHPRSTYTNFGDIDGDGIAEDFNKLEDRKKCVDHMINRYLELWDEKSYENLVLGGFYWYEEDFHYSDPLEIDTVIYACNRVHEEGYKMTWIPWYQAPGYQDWENLGIDVACMQPNYFWNDPIERVSENARITKLLGMCVEFEVDNAAIGNDVIRKRYKEYLKQGINYGYMTDTIHMYYIGGGTGLFYQAYQSKDPYDRSIYDDTYKFMKGTLELVQPEQPENIDFSCDVNGVINGRLEFDSTGTNSYMLLHSSPKYGELTVKNDGSFSYKPLEGFGGTDIFYIIIDNDYNTTSPVKVTVNVGE